MVFVHFNLRIDNLNVSVTPLPQNTRVNLKFLIGSEIVLMCDFQKNQERLHRPAGGPNPTQSLPNRRFQERPLLLVPGLPFPDSTTVTLLQVKRSLRPWRRSSGGPTPPPGPHPSDPVRRSRRPRVLCSRRSRVGRHLHFRLNRPCRRRRRSSWNWGKSGKKSWRRRLRIGWHCLVRRGRY